MLLFFLCISLLFFNNKASHQNKVSHQSVLSNCNILSKKSFLSKYYNQANLLVEKRSPLIDLSDENMEEKTVHRCDIGRGGSTANDVTENLCWSCFYYDAVKTVSVRLAWYGVFWRILSFCAIVIFYIGLYQLWIMGGYKESANDAEIISFPKIRGFLKTNFSPEQFEDPEQYQKYNDKSYDANDDFFEKRDDSFFIPTNMIKTPKQRKDKCAAYPSTLNSCTSKGAKQLCENQVWIDDVDNPESRMEDNGIRTGRCIIHDEKNGTGTCEYEGWCPPKDRRTPNVAVLSGTKDFAVQMQQKISFPMFQIDLTNSNLNPKTNCSFASENLETKHCRNFPVSEMVKATSRVDKNRTFEDLAQCGGVIKMTIHWECFLGLWRLCNVNLLTWMNTRDYDWIEHNCLASYNFTLIGGKTSLSNNSQTKLTDEEKECVGNWDQWFVTKTHYHDENSRNFYQIYGILFKIETTYDVSRLCIWNVFILLAGCFAIFKSLEIIFYLIFHLLIKLKPWGFFQCSQGFNTDEYWDALYTILPDKDASDDRKQTEVESEDSEEENISNDITESRSDHSEVVQCAQDISPNLPIFQVNPLH